MDKQDKDLPITKVMAQKDQSEADHIKELVDKFAPTITKVRSLSSLQLSILSEF